VAIQAVSRREFLRVGAGSAVAAATLLTAGTGVAQAEGVTVASYVLSPTSTGRWCRRGHNKGDCSSCGACTKHAANKVFRSADAAEAGRAHPRCRCEVVAGPALSPTVFDTLFGDSTPSVDRRDPNIAALIGAADADGVPVPIFSSATPVLLGGAAAAGLAVWWVRSRRMQPALADDADHGDLR
jgi:hypothetical protein